MHLHFQGYVLLSIVVTRSKSSKRKQQEVNEKLFIIESVLFLRSTIQNNYYLLFGTRRQVESILMAVYCLKHLIISENRVKFSFEFIFIILSKLCKWLCIYG